MSQRAEIIGASGNGSTSSSGDKPHREFGGSLVGEAVAYKFAQKGLVMPGTALGSMIQEELATIVNFGDLRVVERQSRVKKSKSRLVVGQALVVREEELTDEALKTPALFAELAWRRDPGQNDRGHLSFNELNSEYQKKFIDREMQRIGVPPSDESFFLQTMLELRRRCTEPGFKTTFFARGELEINREKRPLETYSLPRSDFYGNTPRKISLLYAHVPRETEQVLVLVGFYRPDNIGEDLGVVLANLYNPIVQQQA